jgi:hypothetical protein
MNLDSSEIYYLERKKLGKLSTKSLEKLIGELYDEIYIQYNPERKEYHRMAVFVLNSRSKRSSLIFHLKNFIG